jgi:hypothetical protein
VEGKIVHNEIRYLAEKTPKQNFESIPYLLLTAYSKMQEKLNDLRVKFLIQTEAKVNI